MNHKPHARAKTHKINLVILAAVILFALGRLFPVESMMVCGALALIGSILWHTWDIHKTGIIERLQK